MNTGESKQRILGIDYGTKRIGLSVSDPLGIIAQPYQSLENNSLLINRLREIIIDKNIKTVVIGLPLNLKGKDSEKTREVKEFIDTLKKELEIEIIEWDERFTTSIAQQTMIDMGTKRKERQKKDGRIDSMSAAIMLQSFLDSKRN